MCSEQPLCSDVGNIRTSKAWPLSLRSSQPSKKEKDLHECQGSMISSGHKDARTARYIGQATTLTWS